MSNKKQISDEKRLAKNKKIAETQKATKERRSKMNVKCYDIKLIKNKMSSYQRNYLKNLFREWKQLRNTCLANDLKSSDKIILKSWKELPIEYLSSQMKLSIHQQLVQDAKNLKKKKDKWWKIWMLRFIDELRTINLIQYWKTYQFKNWKLKIQWIKTLFHVKWLEQIDFDWELANAYLMNLPDGYHLKVVNYIQLKEKTIEWSLGIDTWIKNTLTFSNGQQVKFETIKETPSKYHVNISKANKWSCKRRKAKMKLRNMNLKRQQKQKDRENKIKNKLKRYEVIIEDINYQEWFELFWKEMQNLRLGFINKLDNVKKIDRWYPSSKTCSYCWNVKWDLKLTERIYYCEKCWKRNDRDINASLNILKEWKSLYEPIIKPINFNNIPYITTY